MVTDVQLCDMLRERAIPFDRVDHPPVFTCEEAAVHLAGVAGVGSKNLFLRNKKGDKHYLVSVREDKRVDLASLSEIIGSGKLGFGSEDRLKRYLGVAAGSVTLFGVVNDEARAVSVFIDEDLWSAPSIQCHPLVNTATLLISPASLFRFFECVGVVPKIIAIPVSVFVTASPVGC